MSRQQRVSASELARRAIDAYTSGQTLSETEEEAAARSLLRDIHTQVHATLERIDKETLVKLEDHERRLIRIETLIEFSQTRRRELPKT